MKRFLSLSWAGEGRQLGRLSVTNPEGRFTKILLRFALFAGVLVTIEVLAVEPATRLACDTLPGARCKFDGPVGERVRANVDNWLLCAPQANPGMLEMFRLRDRKPLPELVPWAGEFVGKYLISAVQALRMVEDARLRQQVAEVVAGLIATQAEDGYLGPFPKAERLRGHWDLWGHYHALVALLLWHEQSGVAAALAAARKAADLVCATYLDTGHRVIEAGDPEMNMAILTGLAMLHRATGEPRYLRMAREVETDWERAGDYLRAGLDGREFFRSPRPRWESLHDLQGLFELWRITGDARYRAAFEHHWRSIRRWDRRNTGGFSSGEQATGNPYAPTPIETCCTVAWMALSIDYLRLTGDPRAADDLELATLNGGLGAQHPSGRWWTYNTPMDGTREASAHTIVFQARAGTPELNCCSVNGPRILGSLSEWAVMSASNGVVLNWLGKMRCTASLPDGVPIEINSSADAWREGKTELSVISAATRPFALKVRIPAWARTARARLNGAPLPNVLPGAYLTFNRNWAASDRLEILFPLPLRHVMGANAASGKVSVYRGPLLLAYDQAQNDFDEAALPALDLARLAEAQTLPPAGTHTTWDAGLSPWVTVAVPTANGPTLRLVDFASAGAGGTRYRSWLPAHAAPPPPALTQIPPDAARVPLGGVRFQWRAPRSPEISCRVEFSSQETFTAGTGWSTNVQGTTVVLDLPQLWPRAARPAAVLWWRVVSSNAQGESLADVPPAWFRLDPAAPPLPLAPVAKLGPGGEIVRHSLRQETPPEWGELRSARFTERDAEGTELNGRDQMLIYSVSAWPEEDFTVRVRVRLKALPTNRIGQVFSAWAASMDDPLRIVVENGKLFARIEAGGGGSTPGTPVEANRWYAVAALKQEGKLTLYVDGRAVGSCPAPELNNTQAQDCALGGNPHYSGNECLAARFADFGFWARALSPAELQAEGKEPLVNTTNQH